MPLCAGLLYWHLGQPSGIGAPKHTVADASNITRADFEAMTAQAGAAHGRQPGRSGRLADAGPRVQGARALSGGGRRPCGEADRRKPDEPEILVEYAEALALQRGRDLDGEPMRLLERALKIDPNHPKALTLAGAAAFEAKDYKRAIAYWERLLGAGARGFRAGAGARRPALAQARQLAGGEAGRPRRPRPHLPGRRRSAARCAWPQRSRAAPLRRTRCSWSRARPRGRACRWRWCAAR